VIFGKDEKMKKGLIVSSIIAAALLLCSLSTPIPADEKEDNKKAEGGHYEHFSPWQETVEQTMNRLYETDPVRARRLERLQKEDPEAFREELRKLMRERIGKRLRGESKTDTMRRLQHRLEAKGKGFGEPDYRRRRLIEPAKMEEYLDWLKENYPEEAEKLTSLRRNNLQLYRRKLGLSFARYRKIFEASKSNPALAEVLKEDLKLKDQRRRLLRQIKAATPEQREKLIQQLEQVVARRYDLIVQRKQIEYERLLDRLRKLQEEVERSKGELKNWKDPAFKDKNVKERVKKLIGEIRDFTWD